MYSENETVIKNPIVKYYKNVLFRNFRCFQNQFFRIFRHCFHITKIVREMLFLRKSMTWENNELFSRAKAQILVGLLFPDLKVGANE